MRKTVVRKAWFMACVVVAASAYSVPVVRAQSQAATQEEEPLESDRPGFGTSTETVAAGRVQLETGLSAARQGGARQYSFGELMIRGGLNDKTELFIELPSYLRARDSGSTASGLGDGSIGFKRKLTEGSPEFGLKKPAISILGALEVPVGSREFRSSGVQPTVNLLLSNQLSSSVSLTTNFNYSYLKDSSRYHEFAAVASLDFSLSERVGSFIEAYGIFPSGGRDSTRFVEGGVTYLLDNNTQIDASIGFGLGNDVGGPDFSYGFGLSRRF